MPFPSDISSFPLFHPALRYIWVVIGPSGCGKTTVAEFLAGKLHVPYIEGDDFHPPKNIEKMASGIPLTDDDRWGWLATLREKASGASQGCVIACSCLKRRYRDVIRLAELESGDVVVQFIYLSLTMELIVERVKKRKGHFFKDEMVHSQFEALEEPREDERDVVLVDASASRDFVRSQVFERALERMFNDGISICPYLK